MNSVKKLNKLANKFELKLNKIAQEIGNNKPIVADAFFRDTKSRKDEESFKNFLSKSDSHFQKSIQDVPSTSSINVGAAVNAQSGVAEFKVSCQNVNKETLQKIINALNLDYKIYYGKTPSEFLAQKVKSKLVYPPDLNLEFVPIITF